MLAALQGNAKSQEKMSAAYGLGRGVLKDYVQSYKWLALAVSRMSGEEFESKSKVLNALADWLPDSQLDTARQLAKDWQPLTFEEAKEVFIALPPLDANCRDAWSEIGALALRERDADLKCLPNTSGGRK